MVGCGDGRMLVEAARLGARALGIDVNPYCLRRSHEAAARAGPPLAARVRVVEHDLQRLPSLEGYAAASVVYVYLYPKAVPAEKLAGLLQLAGRSMRTLDLHAMVAFDASSAATASHTVTGDCTLSPPVVEAYAAHLPEARVVLNGYGPTFTFAASRRPGGANFSTVSFDYYLDPAGTVASIAADLATLGRINAAGPYLLAVHVREWSTVGRVAEVLARLPAEYALLPVHEWIPIANAHPTFLPRYR